MGSLSVGPDLDLLQMSPKPPLPKDLVSAWLTDLANSETGQIRLVNMFLSWRQKIVTDDQLHDFMSSCLSSTLTDAEDRFKEACGKDDGVKVLFFAFSPTQKDAIDPKEGYCTAVTTRVFHTYMLAKSHKSVAYGRVSKRLNYTPQAPDEEQEYVDRLKAITSKPDWAEPTATLGKWFPYPINCWFTHSAEILMEFSRWPSRGEIATAIRDALGLIDRIDGDHLLIIGFTGGWLKSLMAVTTARPTFADGGNRRFAAYQTGRAFVENETKGSGTTIHLRKLALNEAHVCGLPELISSPLPMSSGNFSVGYAGRVMGTHGSILGIDDDASFCSRLRGSDTVNEIIESLTMAVTS
jgi:hypothetical protein